MEDVAWRAEKCQRELPASSVHDSQDARLVLARFVGARARFAAELRAAAEAMERDPDAAALALDGMLWRIIRAWYAAYDVPSRWSGDPLVDLAQRAPELAWRLRLALRAPDAAARLAHARQLLAACAAEIAASLAAYADEELSVPVAGEALDALARGGAGEWIGVCARSRAPRIVKEVRHDVR